MASASAPTAEQKRALWVEPPTGSHIGGGFVNRGGNTGSNDEPGLANAITAINSAESSQQERSYALAAVSVVSGVSQAQLLKQQNQMRLRLGELLAFNTIARNHQPKVQELVNLRSQGKSWTNLAQANGMNIATVAKIARRANELTVDSYLKGSQEGTATADQLHDFGRAPAGVRSSVTPPGP
ncbi:MAG: hypothetical protein ACREIF_19340 [Chthoniobacterales bacterium]